MKRRRNIIFFQCAGPPLLFMQIFGLLHLRRLSGTQPHYHNHSYAASRELIKCGPKARDAAIEKRAREPAQNTRRLHGHF